MNLGEKLAEGKTKVVYAHLDDPTLAVLQHKDGITAGDGARRDTIPGKGALAGRTTANVFTLLNRAGIATHFLAAPEPTLTIVRRCIMLPLEVVMRRRATGSYLKRHPDVAEGTRFDPPLVEFFLKDDVRHDPQIAPDEIVAQGIATAAEVSQMVATGRQVFAVLERAWADQAVTLVDLKIELGRAYGEGLAAEEGHPHGGGHPHGEGHPQGVGHPPGVPLLVADVIDNDSWRIWPGGEKDRMLDKQVYRNAQSVDGDVLEDVRQRYALVADLTDAFRTA